jgi:dihydrofolate synthase/folylpolyglutamate synthase
VAYEKAGIIKPGIPVVIGEYTPETKPVFLAKAKECNSDIYFASDLVTETYSSDLIGDYQLYNKKTVLQTIAVLNTEKEFKIFHEDIKSGLLQVVKNTGLQGRWQQLGDFPKIICDTAHNKNGLEIVMNQIKKEKFEKLHIVLGVVNDKDLKEVLPLFPTNAIYYFCKPNIPRGLDSKTLQEEAQKYHLQGNTYPFITDAYESSKNNATINDFIFIGGSTFVVAELPLK